MMTNDLKQEVDAFLGEFVSCAGLYIWYCFTSTKTSILRMYVA
jgi:hypothetical protein